VVYLDAYVYTHIIFFAPNNRVGVFKFVLLWYCSVYGATAILDKTVFVGVNFIKDSSLLIFVDFWKSQCLYWIRQFLSANILSCMFYQRYLHMAQCLFFLKTHMAQCDNMDVEHAASQVLTIIVTVFVH
jgi:hypothetical protein